MAHLFGFKFFPLRVEKTPGTSCGAPLISLARRLGSIFFEPVFGTGNPGRNFGSGDDKQHEYPLVN